MWKGKLRQRKREFEHAKARGEGFPRQTNPISPIDTTDSAVFEGSKMLVKSLAGILVISFKIRTENNRGQNQLILDRAHVAGISRFSSE